MMAKQRVHDAIKDAEDKKSLETSQWYLERKAKDEFGTKPLVENNMNMQSEKIIVEFIE